MSNRIARKAALQKLVEAIKKEDIDTYQKKDELNKLYELLKTIRNNIKSLESIDPLVFSKLTNAIPVIEKRMQDIEVKYKAVGNIQKKYKERGYKEYACPNCRKLMGKINFVPLEYFIKDGHAKLIHGEKCPHCEDDSHWLKFTNGKSYCVECGEIREGGDSIEPDW